MSPVLEAEGEKPGRSDTPEALSNVDEAEEIARGREVKDSDARRLVESRIACDEVDRDGEVMRLRMSEWPQERQGRPWSLLVTQHAVWYRKVVAFRHAIPSHRLLCFPRDAGSSYRVPATDVGVGRGE